jgi:hypothetical protein
VISLRENRNHMIWNNFQLAAIFFLLLRQMA